MISSTFLSKCCDSSFHSHQGVLGSYQVPAVTWILEENDEKINHLYVYRSCTGVVNWSIRLQRDLNGFSAIPGCLLWQFEFSISTPWRVRCTVKYLSQTISWSAPRDGVPYFSTWRFTEYAKGSSCRTVPSMGNDQYFLTQQEMIYYWKGWVSMYTFQHLLELQKPIEAFELSMERHLAFGSIQTSS